MKVLFYGRLAASLGPELEIEAPMGCTVAELRDRLITGHPRAEEMLGGPRVRAVVAGTVVHDDYRLDSAGPVEFLPPVSGG